jgi:hypothetical protein
MRVHVAHDTLQMSCYQQAFDTLGNGRARYLGYERAIKALDADLKEANKSLETA